MKNVKMLLSVILAVSMLAFLFAACGTLKEVSEPASTESSTQEATKPAEKKTIIIYAASTAEWTETDTPHFTKGFEDQNNCTVKYLLVDSEKYTQIFMVVLNGGAQVDGMALNGQEVRGFALKGLIADLTQEITYKDRFYESAVKLFTINEKIYGVPFGRGWTSGVYYNKDLFDKYSVKVPETYTDMLAARDAFKPYGISFFGFGGATTYMWPMWYMDTFAQTSGNKSIERTNEALAGKAKFTDPDFVEAMKIFGDFGKDKLFQPGVNGADSNAGLQAFLSGKAACFFGGTWETPGLRAGGMDDKKIHLGIIPFPVLKDGYKSEQCGSTAGSALCLYSKVAEDNRALTLKFIDYLSSDEIVAKAFTMPSIVAKTGGNWDFMAPNKNVKSPDPSMGDPLNQILREKLVPSTTVTYLDWMWPPEVTTEFQKGIQAVVGGQITAEAEMAKIQKVFDDLVSSGWDPNAVK